MKSEFGQWLTDLQKIATKENIIVEAQHYDVLEYLFRSGHTPDDAYLNYIEVKQRIEAIENASYEDNQREADRIVNEFDEW